MFAGGLYLRPITSVNASSKAEDNRRTQETATDDLGQPAPETG